MSVTARQREHYSHMYIVAVLRGMYNMCKVGRFVLTI